MATVPPFVEQQLAAAHWAKWQRVTVLHVDPVSLLATVVPADGTVATPGAPATALAATPSTDGAAVTGVTLCRVSDLLPLIDALLLQTPALTASSLLSSSSSVTGPSHASAAAALTPPWLQGLEPLFGDIAAAAEKHVARCGDVDEALATAAESGASTTPGSLLTSRVFAVVATLASVAPKVCMLHAAPCLACSSRLFCQ